MNHFFSCKKQNSSSQNIFINSEKSKINEEGKYKKNSEKNDNKEQQQLLLNNDNNDSLNNLEIIDYPYSSNNNKDDATVKMNSPYKDKDTQNFVEQITNEVNTNLVLKEKENKNKRQHNINFCHNFSDNSSGIINNEDSVQQNKTLLNNYYNLIKLNNINNISKVPNLKEEKNNILKKINIIENKLADNKSGIKFECPSPPCPDTQKIQTVLNKAKTKFFQNTLILANNSNKSISKNSIKNLKDNRVVSKNKIIEFKGKTKEKIKIKKLIEINNSYLGNRENLTKDNLNTYNTYSVYINKSYNNIKEYKVYKGKLKKIMNKKVESKTINVIKKKKNLNKTITNKTIQNIEQIKKKGKIIKYINNISKSKPMYSSNGNCKSSLLYRMNNELDTLKKTFSIKENKRIINKPIKNKNENNKKINKKLNLNPFITGEKI